MRCCGKGRDTYNEDECQQTSSTETLHTTEDDELQHRLCESARQRANGENDNACDEGDFTTEDVAESTPYLRGRKEDQKGSGGEERGEIEPVASRRK